MNKLQTALRNNALFSAVSGIILIVLHKQMARVFGTENDTVFWVTGLMLLYFSGTLLYEIKKQRSLAVLWIIIQDVGWVLGSIFILVINPFVISQAGLFSIGIVAVIVAYMAIQQAIALGEIDKHPEKKGKRWQFERIVSSDRQSTWKLISDVGNYALFAPNIDHVTIVSGKKQGMVRTCSHGKDTWAETCTFWKEHVGYRYEVHTNEPDYPYPFQYLEGMWSVESIDPATTKIVMQFDFDYKKKYQNILVHPIFRTRFFSVAEELLANWQNELEHKKDMPVTDSVAATSL